MHKKLVDNHVLWEQSCVLEVLFRAEPTTYEEIRNPSDEVLEWWLVTPFLAKLLWEVGETILQTHDCHWWGRQTSGQALHMDEVFKKIAKRF